MPTLNLLNRVTSPLATDLLYLLRAPDGSKTDRGIAVQDLLGNVLDVRGYGAVGNGSTDDSAAIQAAIDAAAAAGGGFVYVPSAASGYAIASTLTLKSKVVLVLSPGATILWSGASGGTMFNTSSTNPTQRCGIVSNGGVIHGGGASGASTILDLHSVQLSVFSGLVFQFCRDNCHVVKLTADATNASGYESSRNCVFNRFSRLAVDSNCHTAFELAGQVSPAGVVALNTFEDLEARSILNYGIRVVQWADNNVWQGCIRLELSANNAIGVILNDSGTPTSDVGVYGNVFHALAVDTFAGPTGRKAVVLNKSKQTAIHYFYNTPAAEGGVIVDNNSDSHGIRQAMPDGTMQEYAKYVIKDAPGGNQVLVDSYGFKVLTPAGVEAFSVKGADGFAKCSGALQAALAIYDANLNQVVGNRVTGWTAATNTVSRATFDTATVTTAQLAQRVKAIIDDLITHGLIGS